MAAWAVTGVEMGVETAAETAAKVRAARVVVMVLPRNWEPRNSDRKFPCTRRSLMPSRGTNQCHPHRNHRNQPRTCSSRRQGLVTDCYFPPLEWRLAQSDRNLSTGPLTSHRCRSHLAASLSRLLTYLTQPNWHQRCDVAQRNSSTLESPRGPTGRFHQHYMCPTQSQISRHHWTGLPTPCSSRTACGCWRRSVSYMPNSDH